MQGLLENILGHVEVLHETRERHNIAATTRCTAVTTTGTCTGKGIEVEGHEHDGLQGAHLDVVTTFRAGLWTRSTVVCMKKGYRNDVMRIVFYRGSAAEVAFE